ncbi:unnamed protein product [Diabrotica balteata]|uniref:AMP-dependent synthetase/ligase domain-containing protein n=1 Tax=Diabrotica balteata TaxID=107213 RepID=A0A9N9XHI3_DIABA|nr:unnamed protein product [Diabrotica balteata]
MTDTDILAAGLIELGLEPNDRIALIIHNSIEGILANFACIRDGFVADNLNPELQHREMKICIKVTQKHDNS